MLTEAGNRWILDVGSRALYDELTAYGGPWAAPLDFSREEITTPGTGLIRKLVDWPKEHQLYARWIATEADVGRICPWVGFAATDDGPILTYIHVTRLELHVGSQLSVLGPLEFRIG
jgi:hypothetical protein